VWQALRAELHPRGVEVVTVSLDTGGADAARMWIEKAAPEHPSLIDQAHVTAELFGFVNVPNAVWIDETGVLVRPAHAANIRLSPLRNMEVPEGLGRLGEQLTEVKKIRTDPEGYREAILDWVEHGPDSRFALTPDQVIERSRPRPREHAEAAACFEIAQHLWRTGDRDAAVAWFKRAHALHPENWTYKRQAWTFATTKPGEPSDLIQDLNDTYDSSWVDDVKRFGAENYYEPFEESEA
jgi:hypothetical protein